MDLRERKAEERLFCRGFPSDQRRTSFIATKERQTDIHCVSRPNARPRLEKRERITRMRRVLIRRMLRNNEMKIYCRPERSENVVEGSIRKYFLIDPSTALRFAQDDRR